MDDGKPLKLKAREMNYRMRRIGELARKLDVEILKALKNRDYRDLDQGPAERFLVMLAERRDRAQWRPAIHKFVQWFGDAYPRSPFVRKEQGVEIVPVPEDERIGHLIKEKPVDDGTGAATVGSAQPSATGLSPVLPAANPVA